MKLGDILVICDDLFIHYPDGGLIKHMAYELNYIAADKRETHSYGSLIKPIEQMKTIK